MIGLVIVSHSERLAQGILEMIKMIPNWESRVRIAAAGGLDDGGFGTSYEKILQAIENSASDEGIIILGDLGSSFLTAELCLESLPEELKSLVYISYAPLFEGALTVTSLAVAGAQISEILERLKRMAVATGKLSSEAPQEISVASSSKSALVEVAIPSGFHARPAAMFVKIASKFSSRIKVRNVTRGGDFADAKSLVEVSTKAMAEKGELVEIVAEGDDAKEALSALRELIQSKLIELENTAIADAEVTREEIAVGNRRKQEQVTEARLLFVGIPLFPGIAIGKSILLQHNMYEQPFHPTIPQNFDLKILHNAFETLTKRLHSRKEKIIQLKGKSADYLAAIYEFQISLLNDPKTFAAIVGGVSSGLSLTESVNRFFEKLEHEFENGPSFMKERRADLRDLKMNLLSILTGMDLSVGKEKLSSDSIVIIKELYPSEILSLLEYSISGLVMTDVGPNSHVAILAKMLGIVSVTGVGDEILQIPDGTNVCLDATSGRVLVEPSESALRKMMQKKAILVGKIEASKSESRSTRTRDGKRVEIVANCGPLETVLEAYRNGAEGIGLLRTEFMFLDRQAPPSVEEQAEFFQEVAELSREKPVVVRTLDVGGDKAAPYIQIEREENPFLGVRGMRVYKIYPWVVKQQVEALLRVSGMSNFKLMVPMVSTADDVLWIRNFLEREFGAMPVEFGIMVEVPSIALTIRSVLNYVDFLSFGTNDLTQYILAADRNNPRVQYVYDHLDPSVLKLMKFATEEAHKVGKWVGVCGELASDPLAIPVLVGLGVDELSVVPKLVPNVKAIVADISFRECEKIASHALELSSGREVREFLSKAFN